MTDASPRLRPYVLFSYTTKHLPKKDKVRFYYALKGRDSHSGVTTAYHAEHIGKGVLLVPSAHKSDIHDFLSFWHCTFTEKEVLTK